MLSVTDAAVQELSDLLQQTDSAESQCVRLIQTDDALGLRLDTPQEGDQVVSDEDRPVLLVEPALAEALEGATLDAVDTQDGRQLMLVGNESESPGADSQNGMR